jgi:hypothetical protein
MVWSARPACRRQRRRAAADRRRQDRSARAQRQRHRSPGPIYPTLEAATAARAPSLLWPGRPRSQRMAWRRRRTARTRDPVQAAGLPTRPGAAITPAAVWELVDAPHDGVALGDGDGMLTPGNLRAGAQGLADGRRARLVGLRKTERHSRVEISLSRVTTAAGRFTCRDPEHHRTRRVADLADLARASGKRQRAPAVIPAQRPARNLTALARVARCG